MERRKLTVGVKLGYGAGEFGPDLLFIVLSMIVMNYLTDNVGLSAGLAGMALMVSRVWDAVIDPLIGHISDRTTTRMGRRMPYILGGGLVTLIAMIVMFTNPSLLFGAGLSQMALFIYAVAAYIFLCTAYSAIFIPYAALAPELTTDYHERTSMNGYRYCFSVAATLLGAALALPIIGLAEDKRMGFVLMGAIFGTAVFISALITVLVVREPARTTPASTVGFWKSALLVFKNKPFVLVMTCYVLNMLGIGLSSAIAIYFWKYIIGVEKMFTLAMVILLVTTFIFIPISVAFNKKVGKKIPYGVGLIIMAAALMLMYFFGHTRGVNFCLAMNLLYGIGCGICYASPYTIALDAIEYDYLITGERREGTFFGIWSWVAQLAQALAAVIMGSTLEYMGYVANVMPQSASAQHAIRLFLGPVNAVLFIAAAVVVYYYPITQKRYQEILAQIAERDAKEVVDKGLR